MIDYLLRLLQPFDFDSTVTVPLATLAGALVAILLIVAVEMILKRVMLRFIRRFAKQTTTLIDDLFVRYRVFDRVAHLVPPVLAYRLVKPVLQYYPEPVALVQDLLVIYFGIGIVLLLLAVFEAIQEFFTSHSSGLRLPVKSIAQVLKALVITLGLVFVISRLLGKSPVVFFSGIGAFTAVLLLVFKDSILGLVAGIQLSSNDLVRIGDWIELSRYGADGVVTDISLVTVSVQNFDKSIVVLPAYTLISEGFRNWRGMEESPGRRIKRYISLDMTSIRFLDDETKGALQEVRLLKPYLDERSREVDEYNRVHGFEGLSPINGRRLTNLGTFRAYLEAYLRNLSTINTDMTVMVRYLQADGMGLPLEVYCFTNEKETNTYENVLADIMDHILAVLPWFGLRVYQLQGFTLPETPKP